MLRPLPVPQAHPVTPRYKAEGSRQTGIVVEGSQNHTKIKAASEDGRVIGTTNKIK